MRIVDSFDPKFSGPLDVRFSVKTKKQLDDLGKSVVSYAFMKVVCEEDEMTYELSRDKKKWVLFTAKGGKGDPGKDGTDGKSAYDIAVDKGFEGTEEEWLESLKGETGKKGDPGPALEVGTVSLKEGDLALAIVKDIETGKLNFTLTLPSYLTTGDIEELKTEDKTVVGAINELYNLLKPEEGE